MPRNKVIKASDPRIAPFVAMNIANAIKLAPDLKGADLLALKIAAGYAACRAIEAGALDGKK